MRPTFLACLLAIPLALTQLGCSDQACIQWSQDEGACPAREDAIDFMQRAGCGGQGAVLSVDSEGEFDGVACCYEVTEADQSDAPCAPSGVSVGAGPSPSAGVGPTTATTATGTGGGPTCTGLSCDPVCDPPVDSPSAGSCIVPDNVQVSCNPITNAGCLASEVCDVFFDGFSGAYLCWPGSFFAPSCSGCSAFGECSTGLTCVGACAKFCCEDVDCGMDGLCWPDQLASMGLPGGVCVNDYGIGGAGGMGGAGGEGGAGGAGVGGVGGN